MTYQSLTKKDILNWCDEHNQLEWLLEELDKKTECKVYPRVKVKTEDGKIVSKVDKSNKDNFTTELRDRSFVEVKLAFVKKFMPEIAPKPQEKEPTFKDEVKKLLEAKKGK